jgi:precorrin-8X/cobalt-precorrin-8 methylmutase
MVITKPLSYHTSLIDLAVQRITESKSTHGIGLPDKQCDVLLIGHGSSDPSAREAFLFAARRISRHYRKVTPCFLELDHPNIEQGVRLATESAPQLLIVMPYFLHRGAHVKSDILKDLDGAMSKYHVKHIITGPLGVDEKVVNLVIERSSEAEARANVFKK